MLKRQKSYNQRGDTLVEVLISIAIVSVILAGAFVTSSHSEQGVLNSQEHGVALKYVQSQLEQLRALDQTDPTSNIFTSYTNSSFCMVNGAAVMNLSNCNFDNSGVQKTSGEPLYHISIVRSSSANASLFTVTAKWDQITGGQSQEQMYYRL